LQNSLDEQKKKFHDGLIPQNLLLDLQTVEMFNEMFQFLLEKDDRKSLFQILLEALFQTMNLFDEQESM
jgi:hypothetical protein